MALSITNVTRLNGGACDHIRVDVNAEGQARTFATSFPELDALIDSLGGEVEAVRALLMLWAAYRRRAGRAVVGVVVA